MQSKSGKSADLRFEFASEAPGAEGWHQKQMMMLNNAPKVIFDNMLETWVGSRLGQLLIVERWICSDVLQ